MTGEEWATHADHAREHKALADELAVHAGVHRAELGNQSLFEIVPPAFDRAKDILVWPPSMNLAIKAHLGFMESISHSLIAITEELRLLRERP
jgi:hypothetical protein